MRILCLDIGEKRIGVALSDENAQFAFGLDVLRRQTIDKDMESIAGIVKERGAGSVVIGMPLNMNASLGPQAQAAVKFKGELEKKLDIPVLMYDERLSTVSAERVLIEGNISRKKRKAVTDKLAAQIILQSYLDGRNRE